MGRKEGNRNRKMALAVSPVVFRISIALSDINRSGGQGSMLVLSLGLRFGADCSGSSACVEDAIAPS